MRLWYSKFPLFPEVPFSVIKEAILRDEDDCPRAMIVHHSNPVLVQANEKRTRQALEKLDFMMVTDIFPTATSNWRTWFTYDIGFRKLRVQGLF